MIKRKYIVAFSLVLAFLSIWGYYIFYISTDNALQRAEAFNFRRLKVAEVDNTGVYRFFYSTNRKWLDPQAEPEQRFDKVRETQLKFGYFDSIIEPSLGLGMIIHAAGWNQDELIKLKHVQALDKSAFITQVTKQVQASPFKSLLIIVHGFKEAFPSALRKTAFLSHILDINCPVLVFDWPGNQGKLLQGYREAHRVAQTSGAELAATLRFVVDEIKPEKLWLIANSMGAQVVVDAMSLLYQNQHWMDPQTEFDNIVLTAPDVDHYEFDQRFKNEMKVLTRQLNVYVSSNDRALLLSRYVNRARRRGESTLRPDQLDEAMMIADLLDTRDNLINMVDVTPINRTRNFHSFSLETPEFFDDLYLRLTNIPTPHNRLLYKTKTPEGAVYWVLTRGR